jgi:hypothetical protein
VKSGHIGISGKGSHIWVEYTILVLIFLVCILAILCMIVSFKVYTSELVYTLVGQTRGYRSIIMRTWPGHSGLCVIG